MLSLGGRRWRITNRQASKKQIGKRQVRKRSKSGPMSCIWIVFANSVGPWMTGWKLRPSCY
jgi:hypothetical protein